MKRLTLIAAATSVVAIAACTGTTDPKKAGFLDGVRNQSDGAYDRQIESKQRERTGLERANDLLEEDLARLEEEEARGARELREARAQLSSLDSRVSRLKARYQADSARYQAELAELRRVEDGLSKEASVIQAASGGGGDASASLARLKRLSAVVDSLSTN